MIRCIARLAIVLATWPFVAAADRVRGIHPPARLRTGLRWALGERRSTR